MDDAPVVISPAVRDKLLPFSFLETQLYDRMSQLLEGYLPVADIRFMLAEVRNDLFQGFTQLDSKQLHTLVHHCIKCPNVSHPPITPAWNCTDPDLVVIVENPTTIQAYGELLFSGLKQVGFSSNRCMLTYAVRCKTSDVIQLNVDNCVPYLHTEIAIVNPKLILTIGMGPFQMLTNDSASKLNEIKGIIRSWGVYHILPEVSLGSLYHNNGQGGGMYEGFVLSLAKAYKYLYPDG